MIHQQRARTEGWADLEQTEAGEVWSKQSGPEYRTERW